MAPTWTTLPVADQSQEFAKSLHRPLRSPERPSRLPIRRVVRLGEPSRHLASASRQTSLPPSTSPRRGITISCAMFTPSPVNESPSAIDSARRDHHRFERRAVGRWREGSGQPSNRRIEIVEAGARRPARQSPPRSRTERAVRRRSAIARSWRPTQNRVGVERRNGARIDQLRPRSLPFQFARRPTASDAPFARRRPRSRACPARAIAARPNSIS